MKPLFGDGAMLNLLEFETGAVVAAHSHPHEQLGLMLEGELALTVGGVEHVLQAGDATRSRGRACRACGRWRCRVLDVFQPVREDESGSPVRGTTPVSAPAAGDARTMICEFMTTNVAWPFTSGADFVLYDSSTRASA
jgi:hypothetical protein